MKLLLLFFLMIALCSCASVAKSKKACLISSNSNPLASGKIGAYVLGTIFQIGDCAVSQTLRVEIGDFVDYRKEAIRSEINEDPHENKENLLTLFELFGCQLENKSAYVDFSKKHLTPIFDAKADLSGRAIMLSVRNKIKEDDPIRKMCFK